MQSEHPGWIRRGRPALIGAALGGAIYGAGDALGVVWAGTLAWTVPAVLALGVVEALAAAVAVALAALPLIGSGAALAPRARLGLRDGLAAGLVIPALLDAGELWFSAPPPFTHAPHFQGNPWLFLCFSAMLGAAGVGVAALARRSGAGSLALGTFAAVLLGARWPSARALSPRGTPPAGATRVLLVTLDTTRADHVAAFSEQTAARTPEVDRVAKEGTAFLTAMSQIPVTAASHTTLLSGIGPWDHHVLLNGHPLPDDLPLLAPTLRRAGWRTAAFVSAYVLEGKYGFSRGFEVYDDDFGAPRGWGGTLGGRISEHLARRLHPEQEVERTAGETVDRALAWLDAEKLGEASAPPFFLWVHLFDPHGPYAPPAPWNTAYYQGDPRDPRNTSMRAVSGVAPYLLPSLRGITDLAWVLAQYSGEVSYADQEMGRLLAWLDDHGLARSTLVVVAGDHGESLGEHGVWFNHGDDLYEAATHVPLAMRLPGRIAAGAREAGPVELLDVAPTVYGLLGLPAPGAVAGMDLGPWLRGADAPTASPRPFARSLAYDRPANVAARAKGLLADPTYRVAALRTPEGRYVVREAPGTGSSWLALRGGVEDAQPSAPPEGAAQALEAAGRALLEEESR